MWALMFRLYGPEGRPADGEVTCEVRVGGATYTPKLLSPTFDDHHLEPGELPHYVVFFPNSFEGANKTDGAYDLRWYEAWSRHPVKDLAADPPVLIEGYVSESGPRVSAATVRDIIHTARERGLLSASPKGRPGGELTEKANEILRTESEDPET